MAATESFIEKIEATSKLSFGAKKVPLIWGMIGLNRDSDVLWDKGVPNNEMTGEVMLLKGNLKANWGDKAHWEEDVLDTAATGPTSTASAMRITERASPALTSGSLTAARACKLG